MKKIVILCLSAIFIATSCQKDDQTGIPPIVLEENNPEPENIEIFNASEIDLPIYEGKKGTKVSVKGTISVEGTRVYFILKDNAKILIFAPKSVFDGLPIEVRNKLKINGQELTVTGIFKDFKDKAGTLIREIEYTSASDLVFGQTLSMPTPSVSEIDVLETNLSDVYQEDKSIVLRGKISVENNRSWITFKDGEKIQIFIQNYKNLSQSAKNKLNLPDQEVTLTGKFKTYNSVKQIQIAKEADITFGTTPNQTFNSYIFDFESITLKRKGYDQEGSLSAADGTTLTYKARTDLDKYTINGKGLMLKKDNKQLPVVKIAFKGGVKQLKLKYKAANTSIKNRILAVYQGDENSTTELKKIEFKVGEEGELVLDLNQTTDYTITIKALSDPAITIDDISWEK